MHKRFLLVTNSNMVAWWDSLLSICTYIYMFYVLVFFIWNYLLDSCTVTWPMKWTSFFNKIFHLDLAIEYRCGVEFDTFYFTYDDKNGHKFETQYGAACDFTCRALHGRWKFWSSCKYTASSLYLGFVILQI